MLYLRIRRIPIPEYVYFCSDCDVEFSTIQGMNELPLADCSFCGKLSNWRIPQVFSAIDKTPRTLGGLADARRKEMGETCYQDTLKRMADERRAAATYKGIVPERAEVMEKPAPTRPWYRPDSDKPDLSLNKMTADQKTKFIMENKKPPGLK